jgi:hypothetical protein
MHREGGKSAGLYSLASDESIMTHNTPAIASSPPFRRASETGLEDPANLVFLTYETAGSPEGCRLE